MTQEENIGELRRLIRWTHESGKWEMISNLMTHELDINVQHYAEILHELQQQGFYQVIFMLLCSGDYIVDKAARMASCDVILGNVNEEAIDQFIGRVVANIATLVNEGEV